MKSNRIGSTNNKAYRLKVEGLTLLFTLSCLSKNVSLYAKLTYRPHGRGPIGRNHSLRRTLVRTIEIKHVSNARVAIEHWISQRRAPRCASRKNMG
ncbi:hypothetical protein M6B38_310300 [Iris pallida]|uniref:Uncharacterized protein n=1 Tax=Iris pallida TaxID=29817 RepID=A0AAX6HHR3_IRIPA|nr:hypothetical protein M6B38_310300 [Iris pallida]